MQEFKQLDVWRKAHAMVLGVYRATGAFPDREKFGLVSQMRRSAVSVPSNIAEGAGRDSKAEFARFLDIAMGSAMELDYQLLLSRDLEFLAETTFLAMDARLDEIQKMLVGLKRSLGKA